MKFFQAFHDQMVSFIEKEMGEFKDEVEKEIESQSHEDSKAEGSD